MNHALDPRTPVVVGVGQVGDPTTAADYHAWSPVDLAAQAVRAALHDAGGHDVGGTVDLIAGIRQFEISFPGARAPLGRADNYPRAVAARLGLDPAHAILEVAGGQGPQALIAELAGAIAAGRARAALAVGSEAISTVRHRAGADRPDFAETVGGQLEDRGHGLQGLVTEYQNRHGLLEPITAYSLLDNARRGRLGQARPDYLRGMGELMAPFTAVAEGNPLAAVRQQRSAAELVAVSGRNRMVTDLYPVALVAREKVNLGAAVLLMSVEQARSCGIPQDRWVFLAGHACLREQDLLARADLSITPAAVRAVEHAVAAAGTTVEELATIDLYSCFPIAVATMADELGLSADDPRGLTVTGGLPFFGGPGNNYAMHAIAETVVRMRERPGGYGLVWANGGVFAKHAAGVWTTRPTPWNPDHGTAIQAEIALAPALGVAEHADGPARIETFAIRRSPRGDHAVVVARLDDGRRFLANPAADDSATAALLESEQALGAPVHASAHGLVNRVAV